jgi:hypothetical protein
MIDFKPSPVVYAVTLLIKQSQQGAVIREY